MNTSILLMISSLDLVRGGLTKASLKQANVFSEMGYPTYMLTYNFNPHYPRIRQKLLELNKINENVKILNMYEEFEGNQPPFLKTDKPKTANLEVLSGGNYYEQREGYNAFRVFDNGMYIKYISLKEDNSLDFIDYYNENRHRTKREKYDPWGNLKSITFMDLYLNKARQTIMYTPDGNAFYTEWFSPKTKKSKRIMLFNNELEVSHEYLKDTLSPKVEWTENVINRLDHKPIILSDTRTTDKILTNTNHNKCLKVWRLHSGHLKQPNSILKSNVTDKVEHGYNNIYQYDASIILTEEQKTDIITREGNEVKPLLTTIPHFHETNVKDTNQKKSLKNIFTARREIKKDENVAVIVSRLSSLKQIDHAIKAFHQVVKEIPNANLEIWGTGKEEKHLSELIEEYSLGNNVYLKGYSYNPDEIYQKALFSVLTSKSEGFALAVMESMSNCTPVISYEIKYGPKDMIQDANNGFLIEQNNIEELANKMIYLFQNPKQANSMGEKAKNYIDIHYSKESYKKKWVDLFENLKNQDIN